MLLLLLLLLVTVWQEKKLTCSLKRTYMLRQKLIHLEHVSAISFKNQSQLIIAYDLSLIVRILQVVLANVCPKLLNNLH